MSNDRAASFEEFKPPISEADIYEAAKARRVVASWNSRPVIADESHITALAIKFALVNGSSEAVLLDRYSALVLRMLLEALEKADWRATQISPPGKKPH